MYKNPASWLDLSLEYKGSINQVNGIKERRKHSDELQDKVDCQTANSMEADLRGTVRELKDRILYEYKGITIGDITNPLYGLTERQQYIALLRREYSCSEVAAKLGIEQSTVFRLYEKSVNKILKLKGQKANLLEANLSEGQKEVYILYKKGVKPKQIAEELGISINTVKTQLRRIKEKIEGDKSMQVE